MSAGLAEGAQACPHERSAGGFRLDIQGLRAIAVLFVVVFHAGFYFPGGFVGVDVFFVISGFVITAMLRREWLRSGRIDLRNFYVKRIKRLMPALALVVVVTLVASAAVLSPLGTQQQAAQTALGAVFLASNVAIARTTGGYFDAPAESNPLLNLWSLSVEEQFYLVFPILLAGAWVIGRRFNQKWTPTVWLTVFGLLSFVVAMFGAYGAMPPATNALGLVVEMLTGFYSPVTRAWEFAVGALLALYAYRWRELPRSGATALGVTGIAMLLASAWLITGATRFPGLWTLLPVLGTALLLVAGTRSDAITSRALSSRAMTAIGDWSYSIYLWHWPMIVIARVLTDGNPVAIATAALLSFIPAYISYRWVEEPIRSMPMPTLRSVAGLIAITLLPPVLIAVGILYASGEGYWSDKVRMYQAATVQLHAGAVRGCHTYDPLSESTAEKCEWDAASPGAPIYVIGDSHADHFSEAIIGAGEQLGRPVVISSTPNCPPVRGYLERPASNPVLNTGCQEDMKETLDYLGTSATGTVVMASGATYWTNNTVRYGLTSADASFDARTKLRLYEESLAATVRELQTAGHDVLIVQAVPLRTGEFSWDPTTCSQLDLAQTPSACGVAPTLDEANANVNEARAVIDRVGASTDASVVDPGPAMCPDGLCSIEGDGFVRLMDSVHISVAQSRALTPTFVGALSGGR